MNVSLWAFYKSPDIFLESKSLGHIITGITWGDFDNLSLTTLPPILSSCKKLITYIPFTYPPENLAWSITSSPPDMEESIPLPKAKHRLQSNSFKVMQQIPGRPKTRAPTFELKPCCGLNLVPDMPFSHINHCLSHARLLFFPCRQPYIFIYYRAFPRTVWNLWNRLQVK